MRGRYKEFNYLELNNPYENEIISGIIVNEERDMSKQVGFYYSYYEDAIYLVERDTTSMEYANEVQENGLLDFIADQLRAVTDFKGYHSTFA